MAPKARKASFNGFSESDYEVAEILCELPNLLSDFEFPNLYWRLKGTRTALILRRLAAAMKEEGPITTSPDTPLEFWPEEPKEKVNHVKRKPSQKRKREDLSAEILNLNLERESLMAELQKLRYKLDELKATNLELKAKQRKSKVGDEKGMTNVDIGTKITKVETSEIPEIEQTTERKQDHPPSNENQTAETSAQKSHYPSRKINAFDLNALPSPEEYSGMESWDSPATIDKRTSRIMAAEARQRRLKICRDKNPTAFRKPHYSR